MVSIDSHLDNIFHLELNETNSQSFGKNMKNWLQVVVELVVPEFVRGSTTTTPNSTVQHLRCASVWREWVPVHWLAQETEQLCLNNSMVSVRTNPPTDTIHRLSTVY